MSARLDPSMSPGPACGKCGDERHHNGERWRCRRCDAERQAKWKAGLSGDRRDAVRLRANELRNTRNAAWSPEKRAEVNAGTQKWRESNRERHRELSSAWYRANWDRARQNRQAHYEANLEKYLANNQRRKARQLDAVCEHGPKCVTPEFLAAVHADQCLYCDNLAEHADHFIPLATGGLHCRDNIVPACAPCNSSKKASDPWEWIARLTA